MKRSFVVAKCCSSTSHFAEAESAYAAVNKAGSVSAFFAPALYKHGWAQFKQSLHEESLASFFDLLDYKLVSGE